VVGEAEPEALTAWCAERLAPWKRPRRIDRVAALPRTRAGKLDRRAMGRSGGG
jgi:acyl-CoA synthetase (AMP-forming)/AMP-acid ligase II